MIDFVNYFFALYFTPSFLHVFPRVFLSDQNIFVSPDNYELNRQDLFCTF